MSVANVIIYEIKPFIRILCNSELPHYLKLSQKMASFHEITTFAIDKVHNYGVSLLYNVKTDFAGPDKQLIFPCGSKLVS